MRSSLAALLLLAACDGGGKGGGPVKPPPPAIDAATAGTVRGVVLFKGTPPKNPKLPVGGSAECAALHSQAAFDEQVLVKDGKLRNAFVYVKEGLGGLAFPWPDAPVVVSNLKCVYVPRIAGAQVNQKIRFTNEDPTAHNVHGFSRQGNFNHTLQGNGNHAEVRLGSPEVVMTVKCDLHPWMIGYVGVVPHPFFAVTGDDGAFEFKGLPPGDYTIESWHEKYGVKSQKVKLDPKGSASAEFTYSP